MKDQSSVSGVQKGLPGEVLIGNRIPRDYFVTRGRGESDITIHAGSYHLALKKAGIEMCNIMNYSSIMPGIAREIKRPRKFIHGSVMECISAESSGARGIRQTAGICYGWLFDKKTNERYGGLVCEYHGNDDPKTVGQSLRSSLNELYINGFDKKYSLKNISVNIESLIPKKKFGTALVAICFVNYYVPLIR